MKPLLQLAEDLATGKTTSQALIDEALERIADPNGEGARTIIKVHADRARSAAKASDQLRKVGVVPSPLAGMPVSLKDLFDEAGEVTTAATSILAANPPAEVDCTVVKRIHRSGAIIIGRSNLTEFAYSGLGINRTCGTPRSPWDRETGRIPGGSSCGAAVSVTDGMAAVAVGSDTGGSVRIPSALCGITGFKSTFGRIPLDHVHPLSYSLDSAGPLGNTVSCCALLDAIMAGEEPVVPPAREIASLRLAVPQTLALDDLDDQVANTFESTLSRLAKAGAQITEIAFTELGEILPCAGILAAEAYEFHREQLERVGDRYDPRIRKRILRSEKATAADYVSLMQLRERLIAQANAVTAPFDAILMPTVAVIPPTIAKLDADDDLYSKMNLLVLRNTMVINLLNRCALSIPCHDEGEAPVGLMVVGERMNDSKLVSIGLAIESELKG